MPTPPPTEYGATRALFDAVIGAVEERPEFEGQTLKRFDDLPPEAQHAIFTGTAGVVHAMVAVAAREGRS